jgi:dimeric dUTPase (all-alpha-NTP-PPase superfamily)
MDLTKLFETQKILRDRINYNEPDRFNKLILSLLVELGECANEWRGFKFWSKNQEPRKIKRLKCPTCNGNGMVAIGEGIRGIKICSDCDNPRGGIKTVYPLLEEYVDGLHFVLELGLEIDFILKEFLGANFMDSIESQFIRIFDYATSFAVAYHFTKISPSDRCILPYINLLGYFIGLGEMLGFTWEEVEQAYYAKNKINHQRQEEGY